MIAINEKANMTKVMAVIAMMAVVFAGVAVMASDSTDAADSKITYISGEINANTEFGAGTIVVVNGNLTVVNGAELKIGDGAKFTVNEGVTLTVNGLDADDKPASFVVSALADVDINGTLVISENGKMDFKTTGSSVPEDFKPGFIVNGTITFQNGTKTGFTEMGEILVSGKNHNTVSGKRGGDRTDQIIRLISIMFHDGPSKILNQFPDNGQLNLKFVRHRRPVCLVVGGELHPEMRTALVKDECAVFGRIFLLQFQKELCHSENGVGRHAVRG